MPSADLCTEDEIIQLVNGFYDRVRKNKVLRPVYNRHAKDWDAHLPEIVYFWSSAPRGTARLHGAPMPTHADLAERAKNRAYRITQSLRNVHHMMQGKLA